LAGALISVIAGASLTGDALRRPGLALAQEATPSASAIASPAATATATAAPLPTATPTPVAESPTASLTADATSENPTATPTPFPTPDPNVTEVLIDAAGGVLTSADGRAEITLPPGAVTEPVMVRVSPRDAATLPFNDEHTFIALWDFEAFAVDRAWADVETFAVPLSVKLRLSQADLGGLMRHSLRLYRYDELAGWEALPAEPTGPGEWTVNIDHFSTYGPAADQAVQLPPLANQAGVDLNGGGSLLALPIELPPGRAGFAPQLNLTYSSAAVNEMKSKYAIGSWVGIGFSLDLPYISQTTSGAITRYFLNLNGVSDEVVDAGGGIYRLKREAHLKIRKSCDGGPPGQTCWTVMDKAGASYVFGGTVDSYRYWQEPDAGAWIVRPYRFDLAKATDVHGNSYSVEYARLLVYPHYAFAAPLGPPAPQYVMSSYPLKLVYNKGSLDEVEVRFTTSGQADVGMTSHTDTASFHPYTQTLHLRSDVPYSDGSGSASECSMFYAPVVMDTAYLKEIEVVAKNPNVGGSPYERVRRYEFLYDQPTTACAAPILDRAGELKLKEVKLWDRCAPAICTPALLTTQNFGYASHHYALSGAPPPVGSNSDPYDYTRSFLTSYKNGFGGETTFAYQEMAGSAGSGQWSRVILTAKTEKKGWGGLADITASYEYLDNSGYPDYLPGSGTPAGVDAQYKGYREVKVTDAAGHYSVHKFHTVNVGSPHTYSPLEGREKEVATYANRRSGSRTRPRAPIRRTSCISTWPRPPSRTARSSRRTTW
jgi:hypothetical protein